MTLPVIPPAEYINTDEALNHLMQHLQHEDTLAIDTESNNMYAYHGRVCLIQLSTRTHDYIIDPLMVDNVQLLGPLLRDSQIEKIFHAAEYDLMCLKRDFDFDVVNLFDTMYAATLLGATNIGLADLLSEHFDVALDKSHQTDDWGVRPLPTDSLQYAQMDTHYLPDLRDMLYEQLQRANALDEAYEIFADAARVDVKTRTFDPDGYWKLGRPNALSRRQMAILRQLYTLRDHLARRADTPTYNILSNNMLVDLATHAPANYTELARIANMNAGIIQLYGRMILEAIEQGRASRLPNPPQRERPDPQVAARYTHLHAWRKERAIERGIDSNLVMTKQTLWQLARDMPADMAQLKAVEGIGDFRARTYGPDLLALFESLRNKAK